MYRTLLIFSIFATLPALAAENNSAPEKHVHTHDNTVAPVTPTAVSVPPDTTPAKQTKAAGGVTPFANGELDPAYAGQVAIVEGKVTEIKTALNNGIFFKLDLQKPKIKPVWVATFVPVAEGEIKVGDQLIFKGYVATSDSMDATGALKSLLGSSTLLMARTIETPK